MSESDISEEPEINEVRKVVDEVRHNNLWATRLEVTLVIFVCFVNLAFVAFVARSTAEARKLSKSNRELLQRAEQSNDAASKAVLCVLDNFALHRNTNQEIHDAIAAALKISPTPHSPLPENPSEAKIKEDCNPFVGTRP